MVLPLLGLAALGLGGVLNEPINNFLDQGAARNRRRQLMRGLGKDEGKSPMFGIFGSDSAYGDPLHRAGADDTKFNESGGLFYGGNRRYDPNNFIDDRYQQDLQSQAEANARATASISAGPAYGRLQLAREQWGSDPSNPNSPQYDPNASFNDWRARQEWLLENDTSNPDSPYYQPPQQEPNPAFVYDSPENARAHVAEANLANEVVQNTSDMLDFVQQSGGFGEVWNRSDALGMRAQAALENVPFIARQILDTGVIGNEERPLIEELAGMDNLQGIGDKKAIALLSALQRAAQQQRDTRYGFLERSNVGQYLYGEGGLGLQQRAGGNSGGNAQGGPSGWPQWGGN